MGMNTTEVTKEHITTPSQKLAAHAIAQRAAETAIELAATVRGPLKPVADQLIRAASSVALNLAEGAGHIGGSRKHHWRIAYGSALESSSALGLLQAAGTINHQRASEAEALLDRCRAMTWRLIHGGG
jgi:four helix bundle protein